MLFSRIFGRIFRLLFLTYYFEEQFFLVFNLFLLIINLLLYQRLLFQRPQLTLQRLILLLQFGVLVLAAYLLPCFDLFRHRVGIFTLEVEGLLLLVGG